MDKQQIQKAARESLIVGPMVGFPELRELIPSTKGEYVLYMSGRGIGGCSSFALALYEKKSDGNLEVKVEAPFTAGGDKEALDILLAEESRLKILGYNVTSDL